VRFTANGELHAQIQELRALMRHQIPDGDVGKILARAVPLLLEQVRKRKFGQTKNPKAARQAGESPSRHIPAAVRRTVSKRDGERCTYVSPGGRRCGAQEFLEFHHAEPWVDSRAHPVENVTLRCRAHNQYAAVRDFGERHMARFRGNWI
jgi:5-methylcytosine-specific restriction endonuclease McrA